MSLISTGSDPQGCAKSPDADCLTGFWVPDFGFGDALVQEGAFPASQWFGEAVIPTRHSFSTKVLE